MYLACLQAPSNRSKTDKYWSSNHITTKRKPTRQTSFAAPPRSNNKNVWDEFYKLHNDAFFKDRHYFAKEHVRLCSSLQSTETSVVVRILDFGCGVGNSIVPLLESCSSGVTVHYLGLDISPHAVNILQHRLLPFSARHYLQCRVLDLQDCSEEQWDNALQEFFNGAPEAEKQQQTFDFCLMIFVLSAFEPKKMQPAVVRVSKALRGGGVVCFRDYSVGDMAMERFSKAQQVSRNLYLRQDGTLSFFFAINGLLAMFEEDCAMKCSWARNLNRTIENRAKQTQMKRSWLGAEFVSA